MLSVRVRVHAKSSTKITPVTSNVTTGSLKRFLLHLQIPVLRKFTYKAIPDVEDPDTDIEIIWT